MNSFHPATLAFCPPSVPRPANSSAAPWSTPLTSPRHWPLRYPRIARGRARLRAAASASASASASATPASTTPAPATSPAAPAPPARTPLYDVVVIGAGPAGLSLASAVATEGLCVCCVDATFARPWPNHYGVWYDELDCLGLAHCATHTYQTTAVYAGSDALANSPRQQSELTTPRQTNPSSKISLDRPYIRVDRVKLKSKLVENCKRHRVTFVQRHVSRVEHVSSSCSAIHLVEDENAGDRQVEQVRDDTAIDLEDDFSSADLNTLHARLVVDCTGHAIAFTQHSPQQSHPSHDERPPATSSDTWYQAAYGIEADVRSYPYAKDEMLLMDFRDEHMASEDDSASSRSKPTFLYVFPGGDGRAFFEETSVIQKHPVSFDELKTRLYKRLAHDGVQVVRVHEEERSFIPLGGTLPDLNQRIVAFGGAALLVHPATGYMVGRTVRLAGRVAGVMKAAFDSAGPGGASEQVARACWESMWGLEVRRQRDFLMFGAQLLESLDMSESRAFFKAFFRLPRQLWVRFLAYQLDTPLSRAHFAFAFFVVADNAIRVRLLRAMVEIGRWKMVRSVIPEWLTAHED